MVIAVGGGGIPVVEDQDGLKGIDAMIDKDKSCSKLAQELKADMLIILTAVDCVCINFNKPDQRELKTLTEQENRDYIAEGQFAKVIFYCCQFFFCDLSFFKILSCLL